MHPKISASVLSHNQVWLLLQVNYAPPASRKFYDPHPQTTFSGFMSAPAPETLHPPLKPWIREDVPSGHLVYWEKDDEEDAESRVTHCLQEAREEGTQLTSNAGLSAPFMLQRLLLAPGGTGDDELCLPFCSSPDWLHFPMKQGNGEESQSEEAFLIA